MEQWKGSVRVKGEPQPHLLTVEFKEVNKSPLAGVFNFGKGATLNGQPLSPIATCRENKQNREVDGTISLELFSTNNDMTIKGRSVKGESGAIDNLN